MPITYGVVRDGQLIPHRQTESSHKADNAVPEPQNSVTPNSTPKRRGRPRKAN